MAHKVRVNGTTYEIKGGRTLVGGTGYSVKKGRTLVGGTGYDITFETAALKWVLNTRITAPTEYFGFHESFTYTDFTGLNTIQATGIAAAENFIYYSNYGGGNTIVYYTDTNGWINTVYRTITFTDPPSGELLKWLSANAAPEG